MKALYFCIVFALTIFSGFGEGNSVYYSGNQPPPDSAAVGQSAGDSQAALPADSLKGMDKIEYTSLIELKHQAQMATNPDTQKKLLQQFLDQSGPFLQKYPKEMLLWQIRATSALSLNEPMIGYEAGQKLLASGLADSDPNTAKILAQLNIKGWLDKDKVEAEQKQTEDIKKLNWLVGIWDVTWDWKAISGSGNSRGKEEFRLNCTNINGYEIPNENVVGDDVRAYQTFFNDPLKRRLYADATDDSHAERTKPDLSASIADSGEIHWQCYLPINAPEGLYVFRYHYIVGYPGNLSVGFDIAGRRSDEGETSKQWFPSAWQPVVSSQISDDKKTMTIVIPCQHTDPKSKKPFEYPVTLHFTKSDGTDSSQNQSENKKKKHPVF